MRWVVVVVLVGCGGELVPSLEVRALEESHVTRLVGTAVGGDTRRAAVMLAELDASYAPSGCPIKSVDGDRVTYRGPCTIDFGDGTSYAITGTARVERGAGHRFDDFVVSGTARKPWIQTGIFDGSFEPELQPVSRIDFTVDRDGHALHTELVTICVGARCAVEGELVFDGDAALVSGSLIWSEPDVHAFLQPGSAWSVSGADAAIEARVTEAINGFCELWRVGDGSDQGWCTR